MNRQEALQEIDRIEQKHCKPCPINGSVGNCEGCDHYRSIRAAGDILLGLSNERRIKRDEELFGGIEWVPNLYNYNRLREMDKSKVEIMRMFGYSSAGSFDMKINKWQEEAEMASKLNGLTVEQYKALKGEGKTDKEIREQYDITAGHFSQFKNKNKLVGEFNAHSHNRAVNSEVNKQVNTQVEKPNQDIVSLERYTRAIKAKELVEDRLEKTVDHNKQLVREKEALERKVAEYEQGSNKGLELNEKMNKEKTELQKKIDELEKIKSELKEFSVVQGDRIRALEEEKESLDEDLVHARSEYGLLEKEVLEMRERLHTPADTTEYKRTIAELELFKNAWHNELAKQ